MKELYEMILDHVDQGFSPKEIASFITEYTEEEVFNEIDTLQELGIVYFDVCNNVLIGEQPNGHNC